MSSYSDLYFAGYQVYEMRNSVDPTVMAFLDESERTKRLIDDDDYEDEYYEHLYISTVGKVIKRLEILGFTLDEAKKQFESGINALINYKEEDFDLDEIYCLNDEEKLFLGKFSFDEWRKSIQKIFTSGIRRWGFKDAISKGLIQGDNFPYMGILLNEHEFSLDQTNLSSDPFVDRYLFGFSHYYMPDIDDYGDAQFPYTHPGYIFRAILDVLDDDAEVVLNYGNVYNVEEDEDFTVEVSKKIILVEGSTDRTILEKALSVLHPDLYRYYSFMEFHSTKIPGGTSALVFTIKSFISAGIQNKIIAVFDNDTAAKDAMTSLDSIILPSNIRVIQLPDLDYANNYPTIGPQGQVNINVNGFAGSLELYFGEDILTEEGKLIPIQWKGYNQKLNQYQGELLHKKRLQKKFLYALDDETYNQRNWDAIELVLNAIFTAFN